MERLERPAPDALLGDRSRAGGGHSAIDRKTRVDAAQKTLHGLLPGWSDPEFEAYAQRHYPAYWLKVETVRQAHAKLLHAMAQKAVRWRPRSQRTVSWGDGRHRGRARSPAAFDRHRRRAPQPGATLSTPQIFTTTDGLALDTIFVSRAFELDADDCDAASGSPPTSRGPCAARSGWPKWRRQTDAGRTPRRFRGRAGSDDRQQSFPPLHRGRVYRSRPARPARPHRLLIELNLNIGSAYCDLRRKGGGLFYITDLTGQKINAPGRQTAIKRRLLADFSKD